MRPWIGTTTVVGGREQRRAKMIKYGEREKKTHTRKESTKRKIFSSIRYTHLVLTRSRLQSHCGDGTLGIRAKFSLFLYSSAVPAGILYTLGGGFKREKKSASKKESVAIDCGIGHQDARPGRWLLPGRIKGNACGGGNATRCVRHVRSKW